MLWSIGSFPKCLFHVFLSHSAEDRETLVNPLFEALMARGIIPWFDQRDYPAGTNAYEALRNEILKCRHVIYLITRATLSKGRGWQSLEKAYAGIVQDNFHVWGTELVHVELPLLFVSRRHPVLQRSIWSPIVQKGVFCPPKRQPIDWAADMIHRFVQQEENYAAITSSSVEQDANFFQLARSRPGMFDRLRAAYP